MNPLSHSELRILDANLNRLREGIRVIEDILRYGFDEKALALELKNLRHSCKLQNSPLANLQSLLDSRDSQNDVLKTSIKQEQNREDLKSVVVANFKRAQESARVLEEILKLQGANEGESEGENESENFKTIRYSLYTLEKRVFDSYFKS